MKRWLSFLKKIYLYLPETLACIGVVVIVVLEAMQAIGRYFFRHTFIFVDDVVICCFAWAVFAGAAAAYRRKMHYGLEVLTNSISERIKPYFELGTQVLCAVLFAYMARLSVVLFRNAGTKILFTTGIPYKVIDGAVVFGFVMMVLYSIQFIVEDTRKIIHERKQGGA